MKNMAMPRMMKMRMTSTQKFRVLRIDVITFFKLPVSRPHLRRGAVQLLVDDVQDGRLPLDLIVHLPAQVLQNAQALGDLVQALVLPLLRVFKLIPKRARILRVLHAHPLALLEVLHVDGDVPLPGPVPARPTRSRRRRPPVVWAAPGAPC